MARGLYGQTESDAPSQVATAQRFADVESEGEGSYEGIPTEQAYRQKMATAALREINAIRGERKAAGKDTPAIVRGMEVRGFQNVQRDALEEQAELAEEMWQNGYALNNVFTALTVARPMAYERRGMAAIREFPDPRLNKIRGVRNKPKTYSIERDSLVDGNGIVKERS